jgi:hypothetical protein
MRRLVLLVCAAIPAWAASGCSVSPGVTRCYFDDGIEVTRRRAINSAAEGFWREALGGNARAAYAMLVPELQAKLTLDQFKDQVDAMIAYAPVKVARRSTFFLELKGKSPGKVVCAEDLSRPSGWQALSAADIPEQAHVLMTAETVNNGLTFALWLTPNQGAWKVRSFWMRFSSMAGKDSYQLWEIGRAQAAKGHDLNAAVFTAAAGRLADRGPDFQPGLAQAISESLSKLPPPPADITGDPPFLWKDGAATYKVQSFGPIGVGGKIYVIIEHEVPAGQTDETFTARNKEVLRYFKQRFPEYSDAFAGVIVRALEAGTTRGYGTVEELPGTK